MLPDDRKILINNWLRKSHEAYDDAAFNFKENRFSITLNRIYYSIFYSVTALAVKNEFSTSKHKQLMGWFNKNFIHTGILPPEVDLNIYKKAFNLRNESDYEIDLDITKDEIEELLKDAEVFNNALEKYIKN